MHNIYQTQIKLIIFYVELSVVNYRSCIFIKEKWDISKPNQNKKPIWKKHKKLY
jgi:hypothetical protein